MEQPSSHQRQWPCSCVLAPCVHIGKTQVKEGDAAPTILLCFMTAVLHRFSPAGSAQTGRSSRERARAWELFLRAPVSLGPSPWRRQLGGKSRWENKHSSPVESVRGGDPPIPTACQPVSPLAPPLCSHNNQAMESPLRGGFGFPRCL